MILGTHYYILALGERAHRLYEAFRGDLIDIENTWFPIAAPHGPPHEPLSDDRLQTLMREVDSHFGHYYEQEPLGVVLTGSERDLSVFASITRHGDEVIGRTLRDHSASSVSDLGAIAWSVVKGALACANHKWERELEDARRGELLRAGIEDVSSAIAASGSAILLVEEGYQVAATPIGRQDDEDEDLVEVAVHGVLELGGQVVFVDDGTLTDFARIALILRSSDERGGEEAPAIR